MSGLASPILQYKTRALLVVLRLLLVLLLLLLVLMDEATEDHFEHSLSLMIEAP
jgi:hypothetical protein